LTAHLYYHDAQLRNFQARIVGLRARPLPQVALDCSAFYPESGGQPADRGTLCAPGAPAIPVVDVQEDEDGVIWHTLDRLPPEWTPGQTVLATIDGVRRLDHMQQHTGQHLLSAILVRDFGAPTLSFHLGALTSNIEIGLAELPPEKIETLQETVNREVAADHPITVRFVAREEAEALLAAGSLRKLPPRGGEIRLIEIAGCDCNACGGTHVGSTGAIGGVLLRGIERLRGGVRLEFVCGLRAARAARRDFETLAQLSQTLSVAPALVPDAVERLGQEARSSSRAMRKLEEELAAVEAAQLVAAVPEIAGRRLVEKAVERGPDYAKLLASRVAGAAPRTLAAVSANSGPNVRLYLVRSPELDLHCGAVLKECLAAVGGRGGGTPDAAQGECPSPQVAAVRAALRQRLGAE